MSLHYPPTYGQSTATRPPPSLGPFLGARAHLSLSWLSQYFVALLLVFVSLAFLLAGIPELVQDGKDTLTASCSGVQSAANVVVSLPHYMADGINEMNVKAVDAMVSGTATVLDMSLQAISAIILFMIDMYRSLFLCLLDLAVHGSLTLLINATDEVDSFLTTAFQSVRQEMQDAVGGINKALDGALGLIDDIPGIDFDIPQIDVPDLDFLSNVTLPSSILDGLTSLNESIPTLDELRATLDSAISTPINSLRASINSTLSNATIDVDTLPVPAKGTVDLCSNLDTSFISDVGDDIGRFVKIALGLVVVLMVLLVAACAVWERYRYRAFLEGIMRARESWLIDLGVSSASSPNTQADARDALSKSNLLSFISASNHPTLSLYLSRIATWCRMPTDRRTSLYWFGSYICQPVALAFLALGVVGLLLVQIQLAVLEGPLRDLAQSRAADGASEFSSSVTGGINSKMEALGAEWATSSNQRIVALQDNINEDLFGWVNSTTEAMNTTMNQFYDGITDSLTDVFNGTVLQDPVLGLVYCLIGSKIDAVSSALTWIHNHSHIDLPLVSPSAMQLSPNRTADLTEQITSPKSTVSTLSLVDKMINGYARNLRQQRVGFLACLIIWLIVVVMGLLGVWWEWKGAEMWARRFGKAKSREGPAEMIEKPALRPLHLRTDSTVKQTALLEMTALSHEEPYSPLAPPPGSDARAHLHSASSFGSLVEFFRSTAPPSSTELQKQHFDSSTADTAPLRRFTHKAPSFSAPRLPALSRSPSPRRPTVEPCDSEQINLQTGAKVARAYPTGQDDSLRTLDKFKKRKLRQVATVGSKLTGAVRGIQNHAVTGRRRKRSTSWHAIPGEPQQIRPDPAPPRPEFLQQAPLVLSPPSAHATYVSPQHPYARSFVEVPLWTPLAPTKAGRAEQNPFATPFDDADED